MRCTAQVPDSSRALSGFLTKRNGPEIGQSEPKAYRKSGPGQKKIAIDDEGPEAEVGLPMIAIRSLPVVGSNRIDDVTNGQCNFC